MTMAHSCKKTSTQTVLRGAHDFYPTPMSFVDLLLDALDWPELATAWEPCAGDGRLVEALQRRGVHVVSGDVQAGQDFFEIDVAPADTLITNPPFKVIRKFIDHAFDIGVQRMALVTPERLWACGKGSQQWDRHRPSRFANMNWREDYLGKGGSPDRALAVAIWDAPHADACSYEIWQRPA